MNDEPFASKLNKDKLTQLEQEQLSLKKRLEQLDNQSEVINRHINSLKNEKPIKEDEVGEDTEDLLIYCATCSHPVGLKKALVHMERCFTKLEGTVSFGSIVKNDG
jgi:COMPASS component SPP1